MRYIIALGAMLAIFASPVLGESGTQQAVEGLLQPLVESNLFSGSVVVLQNDKVEAEYHAGLADRRFRIPIDSATRFNVASITKSFTAAAILALRDEKKLSLDDTVVRYIADFPYPEITIRQLLTHRSGLMHPVFLPNFYDLARREYTPAQAVKALQVHPLAAPTGTKYIYSDLNYIVLARVIEVASGREFSKFLAEQYFEPLHLDSAGIHSGSRHVISKLASGYQPIEFSGFENSKDFDYSIDSGAAALYISCLDLARWVSMLGAGRAVSETAARDLLGSKDQEGILHFRDVGGQRALDLSGWDNVGFSAEALYLEQQHLAIAVTNNQNNSGVASYIARSVASQLLGQTAKPLEFLKNNPKASEYAGTYRFGRDFYVPGTLMKLVVREGQLMEKQNNPDRLMGMIPLQDGSFIHRSSFSVAKFTKNADGTVTMRFGDFQAVRDSK